MNLHYHGTNDLEMYVREQAVTQGGNLVLTMNRTDPDTNGGLSYVSGMLQSWNKFCFRGGYIEVNVSLPGNDRIPGFWPAGGFSTVFSLLCEGRCVNSNSVLTLSLDDGQFRESGLRSHNRRHVALFL